MLRLASQPPLSAAEPQSSQWEGWHRYLLLYALAMLLLLGVAWTSVSAGRQLRDTLAEVSQLQDATKQLSVLMSQIVDLETGQRGFLLTGDEHYLQPYLQAENTLTAQFRLVDNALGAYPEAREELAAIENALMQKRGEISTSLAIYREQGAAAALQLVRSGFGRQVMDDIRASVGKLTLDARGVIAERQAELERVIATRNLTIFTALGLAIAASAAGLVLLRRHLASLREEERLRLDAERSRRASREKSTFLANMSHEIRTPMNAIFGFSQLLAERVTDPQDKRYVDAILASGRSLLTLINDVLDLSKIEAGKLEVRPAPMSLRETINSATLVFSQLALEKRLRLDAIVDASLPDGVELDQGRLRQMLFNLVGNALKYTDRGHVRIRASATPDAEDELRATILIEVEDSGVGIAAADHQRIFDPFIQAQAEGSQREGTGLGLSITRRLAHLMQGEISLDSEVGRGSTFRIQLPHVALALLPESIASAPLELALVAPLTILVADDIALNRQLIEAFFRGSAHQLIMAEDGEQAVALAKVHRPAVILMDIRMPNLDGVQALEQIRADATLAATRVIAVTASSLLGQEMSLRERFDGYVRKPITREALYAELQRLQPEPTTTEAAAVLHPQALPAVLSLLETIELDTWPQLRNTLAARDIARLVEQLHDAAERCGARALEDYARRLKHAATLFDPAALETLLLEFPTLRTQLAPHSPGTA